MKKYIFSLLLMLSLLNGSFLRNDNTGIVVDTSTNLMWQDEEYGYLNEDLNNGTEKGKALHWDSAIEYCNNLIYGGYSDWYLPNNNELFTIRDLVNYDKNVLNTTTINKVFNNSYPAYFWSSTTISRYGEKAWVINFSDGEPNSNPKISSAIVRCVRTLK